MKVQTSKTERERERKREKEKRKRKRKRKIRALREIRLLVNLDNPIIFQRRAAGGKTKRETSLRNNGRKWNA